MPLTDIFSTSHFQLDESTAEQFSLPAGGFRTVEVYPPATFDVPATLDRFIYGITEYQTTLLGIRNQSPLLTYELRRHTPDRLRFQFAVPTARLERKIRTHLSENVPAVRFDTGVDGLPVTEGDTVGGGVLTARLADVYPFRTEFEGPPINSVAAALHRHAMQDTRIIIQVLFRPAAAVNSELAMATESR